MILKNSSEKFVCKFDNKEYTIPVGNFEVEPALGHFVIAKAHNWGFNVTEVSSKSKPEVAAIREVKPVEDVKEVVEPVEEIVAKKKK